MSLVTHLHQTPLEILDKVGSRDIFNFIPVVKHLVLVSWFPQIPGSPVETVFCWPGVGWIARCIPFPDSLTTPD